MNGHVIFQITKSRKRKGKDVFAFRFSYFHAIRAGTGEGRLEKRLDAGSELGFSGDQGKWIFPFAFPSLLSILAILS